MKYVPAHTVFVPSLYLDRLEVEQDADLECPLDWGWGGEFYLLRSGYSSTLENYNSDSDVMLAFVELRERHGIFEAQRIVKRRLGVDITIRTLHGCSQGDWWEIATIGDIPVESLEQWLRGDVYSVTDIDTSDSLAGIYAESGVKAVEDYMEYMGING